MALTSPGVEVSVINESFYTPSGPGTVPVIFVATAENKRNSSGTGIAAGTLASNAGRPFRVTSQRELGELFGDPLFYSDNAGNMIHGSELNEYGLQTAYSILGVSNSAIVARADVDLSKLEPSATAPAGAPLNGTYWFDTASSSYGILEWNAAPLTQIGGQSFSVIQLITITSPRQVVNFDGGDYTPRQSVGTIGSYAVVSVTNLNAIWYKNTDNVWVELGSPEWSESWPTLTSTESNATITATDSIIINGETIVASTSLVQDFANDINAAGIPGVSAAVVNGILELYSNGPVIDVQNDGGNILGELGISEGVYQPPLLSVQPHTQVPNYKITGSSPRPTGSVWFKTTTPNGGANFVVRRFNGETLLWERVQVPVFLTSEQAIFGLDRSGGGLNIPVNEIFAKANDSESEPKIADFKFYRRVSSGPTVVRSPVVSTQLTPNSEVDFVIQETIVNNNTYSPPVVVSFTASGTADDADALAAAINSANLRNVEASVDNINRVVITHKLGGDIRIEDTNGSLTELGFLPGVTVNLSYSSGTDANTVPSSYTISSWALLDYTASASAPESLTTDGEIWYNSVVDDIDILVHNGNDWVGYRNLPEFLNTDTNGPIVSATRPSSQNGGAPLVSGDLWIDTSDIENYPMMYRWNSDRSEWTLIDKTDQTSENGILFADARWAISGDLRDPSPISELLTSNFKDFDAPDPALYPRGMLLWNLRRSGFNVKRFVRNYVNVTEENIRFGAESMISYYPNRWVTASSNNEDGSGAFGRFAQRKVVVQAIKANIVTNQELRDTETRNFNLIAAPGYPEVVSEMVSLNIDRRQTAFVVGDTPARLTPDATSLGEWATNAKNVATDGDGGSVTFDEYLGLFYPWGFTTDNFGNGIVVPPSHMVLRTMVLSDQVSFPWFAPAGLRRGAVTNATTVGYIGRSGEFVSVSLNNGQRDTLYENSINPIAFLDGSGLVVFGQKTRARTASALDRINVVRLVAFLRRQLEITSRPFLFEQNDQITRDQIKSRVERLCSELITNRGLNDFIVVCDDSNNTPARIDRNELYVDVAIEPLKSIEFIYVPLRIKGTGQISEL
jgi:hypothetical protein